MTPPPRQQTIQSIIDQLRLRDEEDNKTADLNENVSEALTSERLKSSDIETSDKVIWTIDAGDNATGRAARTDHPEGRESVFAAEALAAAFALVRDHRNFRPVHSGRRAHQLRLFQNQKAGSGRLSWPRLKVGRPSIGQEMQRGAELAIFTLGNPKY